MASHALLAPSEEAVTRICVRGVLCVMGLRELFLWNVLIEHFSACQAFRTLNTPTLPSGRQNTLADASNGSYASVPAAHQRNHERSVPASFEDPGARSLSRRTHALPGPSRRPKKYSLGAWYLVRCASSPTHLLLTWDREGRSTRDALTGSSAARRSGGAERSRRPRQTRRPWRRRRTWAAGWRWGRRGPRQGARRWRCSQMPRQS